MKIRHGSDGKDATRPYGFRCNFVLDTESRSTCGASFDTQWMLTKHKEAMSHKKQRRLGTK